MVKKRANRTDMSGEQYGMLTVLSRADDLSKGYPKHPKWFCLCQCGKISTVSASNLVVGRTKSCGCMQRDVPRKLMTTHGMSKTRTYRIWSGMVTRCYNPKSTKFKDYGGRGILMCDPWRDFAQFYADMGDCPDGYSIERIKNDKGYSPENCKWATDVEQKNNKRSVTLYNVNGTPMNVSELAVFYAMPRRMLAKRLQRGWTIHQSLEFHPAPNSHRKITSKSYTGRHEPNF